MTSKVTWSVVTMQKISNYGGEQVSTGLCESTKNLESMGLTSYSYTLKSMKRCHGNIPKPKVPYEYGMTA